jgi:hypothetical protein
MLLALAAYATYVINATQFVLKLRAARLQRRPARAARARRGPRRERRDPIPRAAAGGGCDAPCCANAASARSSAA